jgi:ADP-heptose:LPS heptosyltransferase
MPNSGSTPWIGAERFSSQRIIPTAQNRTENLINMKVNSLRAIDRWLGTCLTLVLSVIRRITERLHKKPPAPVRNLLFVKLAEQGSTVLACGAITRAVEMVGRENVYFLVFEENRFILDALDLIPRQNVICIKTESVISLLMSTAMAVLRMRMLKFDAAVDMEFFSRGSAVFTYLSGASRRVGFHSYTGDGPYRGNLMTHPLVYNPHLHTSQVFETMVEALNHSPELLPAFGMQAPPLGRTPLPAFSAGVDEVEAVRAMLTELTGRDRVPLIILLNANCSDLLPLRRWKSENYISLARRLIDRYEDLYVMFTGGPSEKEPVERLVREVGSDRCVSLAGRTTLRQLLIVYSESQVLVTNDSGPAHFATLTPIDAITLFGPETPRLFAAPSERSHVICAGTVCSPCVNAYNNRLSTCKNNLCMELISVDEVFKKSCEVLENRIKESGHRVSALKRAISG